MTEKIAYVFPGQGAQYQGMGKDFCDNFDIAKEVFQSADKILKRKISDICFFGSDEELKQTMNTQPCIVAVEIAILEVLKKELGLEPFAVAGHSLGEYSAMYSAGVLNLKDTFLAIQKRAEVMSTIQKGKMGVLYYIRGSDDDFCRWNRGDEKKNVSDYVIQSSLRGTRRRSGSSIRISTVAAMNPERGS